MSVDAHILEELARDLEDLGLETTLRAEAGAASLEARGRVRSLKLTYFSTGVNITSGEKTIVIVPKDFLIIINGRRIKSATAMSSKMLTELLIEDAEVEVRFNTRGNLTITIK